MKTVGCEKKTLPSSDEKNSRLPTERIIFWRSPSVYLCSRLSVRQLQRQNTKQYHFIFGQKVYRSKSEDAIEN